MLLLTQMPAVIGPQADDRVLAVRAVVQRVKSSPIGVGELLRQNGTVIVMVDGDCHTDLFAHLFWESDKDYRRSVDSDLLIERDKMSKSAFVGGAWGVPLR